MVLVLLSPKSIFTRTHLDCQAGGVGSKVDKMGGSLGHLLFFFLIPLGIYDSFLGSWGRLGSRKPILL